MNDINSNQLIKDLTLDFFSKINADVRQINKIYEVLVPEKYHHIFSKKNFSITFDPKTASDTSSELIIPGNNILFKIVNICKTKGPITKGFIKNSNLESKTFGVRFYFYITFEGINHFSELSYIDFDINSSELLDIKEELLHDDEINIESVNVESMPSLYMKATKLIRKKYELPEKQFIESILRKKESELEKINHEYERRITETEDKIKESEKNVNSENDKLKLSDELIEKIHKLRIENDDMIKTISAKFEAILSYNLIGASIFSY